MNEVLTQASYLGPARVLSVEGSRVLLALPDAKAWATLALAQGYAPTKGDVLLAIGKADACYVIGVLSGRGQTTLVAHGDLELRAPRGRIDLVARDGIALRADAVDLVARTLRTVVDTVRQRCKELFTQVRGTLRWRARRLETTVEESCRTSAGRIVQRARQDVHIDGEKIHLG